MSVIDFQKKRKQSLKKKLNKAGAPFSTITSLFIEKASPQIGFLIYVQSAFPCTQFYYNEVDKINNGNIYYFGKQLFLAKKGEKHMIVDAYSDIVSIPYEEEKMQRPIKTRPQRQGKAEEPDDHWRPADELPLIKKEIEASCLENAITYFEEKHLTGLGRITITYEDYEPRIKNPDDFFFPRLTC